ncbi:hypothetical protein [Winogradskyella sp.]|uniref:hypothetical protein n=1 Tax=Winogradskyella sp. TaxID=1883156 RepID=UPI0025D03D4C|nr:hypothetical protein [Winogradskyella sp.]
MKRISALCFFVAFTTTLVLNAQRKDLNGQLIADDEVEGLHILNKTASKYAISKEDGSFVILAKVSDTIVISGIKYQVQEYVITQSTIDLGSFNVQLIEKTNELKEVIVGKILTGSLQSDLENSDAKTEINFYDLGIPGYKGKPLTQNERKLHDADAGPTGAIMGGPFGGGVGLNMHKLLNKISGRTKKLKTIVALDDKERCITRLRREYEEAIFQTDTLAENLKNEYFYFCQEDEGFKSLCDENNDLKAIEFLQSKLKAYNKNRESVTKD